MIWIVCWTYEGRQVLKQCASGQEALNTKAAVEESAKMLGLRLVVKVEHVADDCSW